MRTQHFPTKIVTLLSLGLLVLSGCAPQELPHPFYGWQFTDVKVLDDDIPSHSDQESSPDLLALYLRESDQDLQLRLDFFDLTQAPSFNLHLAFDTISGGVELPALTTANFAWDTLVSISASGQIEVQDAHGRPIPQARLQVYRDPSLDHLVLSASRDILPTGLPGYQVLAWLTPPGSHQVLDALPLASNQGRPVQPVQLLMAFSDSFPAYTPVQSLRRWDGAHTGPSGGRHGLVNLLRIAENFDVPVILLDLLNPASLSALDYLGGLETIRSMQANGQVILPLYAPYLSTGEAGVDAQLLDVLTRLNQEMIEGFDLPRSQILYSPCGLPPVEAQAKVIFLEPTGSSQADEADQVVQSLRWKDRTLIILPGGPTALQASPNGPTTVLKQAISAAMLASQALSPGDASKILLLGGKLPASTWGDPQAIRPTLHYLSSRPWLHFLDEQDLTSLETRQPASNFSLPPTTSDSENQLLWQAIESAPENAFTAAANQAYLSLANRVYPQPSEISGLRKLYQSQTWVLLAAAHWAESPQAIASCDPDLDQDGIAECVLASDHLYAVIRPSSGTMTHLFAHKMDPNSQTDRLYQVIGPSSQLVSGLSEASSWDLSAGLHADPGVITGAFLQPGANYSAQAQPGSIMLTSVDGSSQKRFSLSLNAIQVTYQNSSTGLPAQKLPLLLDPWRRFTPGWWQAYQMGCDEQGCTISGPGFLVRVSSDQAMGMSHFLQTQSWMSTTENPNREQPAGHFLPIPLVVMEISPVHSFQVRIEVFSEP